MNANSEAPTTLRSLPHEIKLEILDCLLEPLRQTRDYTRGAQSSLSNLSRTSADWYRLCTPYLYASIRLPRTHTPADALQHQRVHDHDETPLLLARTMRENMSLAQLVKEVDINPRWLPQGHNMRAVAAAYTTIIDSATQAVSITFFVSRDQYKDVLPNVVSAHPALTTLTIGIHTTERDLNIPLLQRTRSVWAQTCDGDEGRDLRVLVFRIAPKLTHLRLFLPGDRKLHAARAATIRSSVPPQVMHLDLFVGATFGAWPSAEEVAEDEHEARDEYEEYVAPALAIGDEEQQRRREYIDATAEAILKLSTTEQVPFDNGYHVVVDAGLHKPRCIDVMPSEHRLQVLTVHFGDRRQHDSAQRLRSLLAAMRARPDLAHLSPRAEHKSDGAPRSEPLLRIRSFPHNDAPPPGSLDAGYPRKLHISALFRLALEDPQHERARAKEVQRAVNSVKWVNE